MNKKVNYIIVGQGLVGSFLAFELLKRKKSFLIIDKGHKSSSSYIAAGVLNPLVLKRYTKTWRADDFLAYNPIFFRAFESLLNKKYFHELPIDKLISSKDEETFWQHRFEKENLSKYLEKVIKPLDSKYKTPTKFKVGRVKQTAWLNIKQLLLDFRAYLLSKNLLLEERIDFDLLAKNETYKGTTYEKVIFCEGASVTQNPYFKALPLSANKGQLMTISSDELPSSSMLKKKVFILPIGNNEFKIGATYAWEWKDDKVDPEKTEMLKTELAEMMEVNYEVINESAGIRPTIIDRRPILGEHPVHKNKYIFNGMGSKGCFMAPLLAKELIDYTENKKELHPEIRVGRYSKHLS